MKRLMMVGVAALMLLGGCQKKHPVKVFVGDTFVGKVEKIAVFPFVSSLHHSDDPDNVAPRTMDLLFRRELDERNDYTFLSPTSFEYAIEGAGLTEQATTFLDDWRQRKVVDKDFLAKLSKVVQSDAVLIGVVDSWQQDQVDYRETQATPSTTVGATVTILSLADGAMVFEASDENFLEGAESEAGDRAVRTSGLGSVRSDPGRRVYEAPAYEEVALKVVKALVSSIPVR